MDAGKIVITGAREHNLKNINVEIPKNTLTVITGLSGSGKSTLAFDTLYAEGRRRYVESLSAYARQFLGQMDKPDVDTIEGLSPAISIEQKSAAHNPRSTVGTVTEVLDYLRLLFARIGTPHCHKCGKEIASMSVDQMTERILSMPENSKIILLAPLVKYQKGRHEKIFMRLKKEGFARVRVNGKIFRTEEISTLEKTKKHQIDVVIDRLIIKSNIKKRLSDSIELALKEGKGQIYIFDIQKNENHLFSETASCPECDISYSDFTPASFSFNSPHGACQKCSGLGSISQFDPDLIVPDKALSLRQGAVIPWEKSDSVQFMEFLDALVTHYKTDIYTPFAQLPEKFINVLMYGSGSEEINFYAERMDKKIIFKKTFEGIVPKLEKKWAQTKSSSVKDNLKKFKSDYVCRACMGSRLNPASSSVTVDGYTLDDLCRLPIEKAIQIFLSLNLMGRDKTIADSILHELNNRLLFLDNVGLGYLSLNRTANTLSGGESQRIRLATQIGSKLSGVLYVLDEPSIGLHQKDNTKLIKTLIELQNLGNTILVVEHDEDTMRHADHIIDIGPAAGLNGGEVIFSGTPDQLMECQDSITGQYLSGKRSIKLPSKRRTPLQNKITIFNATANNLQNLDVSFPLGCFTCVTGVSGSGKSSLVLSTLYKALSNRLHFSKKRAGAHSKIEGIELIDKVIHIDQSPIGKTPRSNPGTYTQVFNHIRELFSATKDAGIKGFKPGRFSFNVKGGRCEACQGDGIIKIEMHFLPDVYVACDVCKGKRYNSETLDIRYKGKNIAEVLNMTINQCVRFFDTIPSIKTRLETLVEVGLGYIKLGQPATTLSGGEAQRMKLAKELSKKGTGKTIYILDEPTTGLHWEDINKLLYVLNRLIDAGNTVVVIEHHLDVIKCADHVIDLGPEGGDKGGKIVAEGTPEQISENKNSYTGYYLKRLLAS